MHDYIRATIEEAADLLHATIGDQGHSVVPRPALDGVESPGVVVTTATKRVEVFGSAFGFHVVVSELS